MHQIDNILCIFVAPQISKQIGWSLTRMELQDGQEEWGWDEPDLLLKIQWWDVRSVFNNFTKDFNHNESINLYPPQNQEAGSPPG